MIVRRTHAVYIYKAFMESIKGLLVDGQKQQFTA